MSIEVDIKKRLGAFTLDISFKADNLRVGLLGASGCGKSMTLKCIAGIEKPDSGYISINDHVVFDSERKINVCPQKRHCGFLFQNYALFPAMTVRENIEIVLCRLPKSERTAKTEKILSRFGLSDFAHLLPCQISGGQQQRAALARIMSFNPDIIMLDEPFSALDFFMKHQTEAKMAELLSGFRGTVLFVSHNRDEIYRICDTLQIISEGKICRAGTCNEIFDNPITVSAARLTGCKNITRCTKTAERTVFAPDWGMTLRTQCTVPDNITHIGIRAHFIKAASKGDEENVFDFDVKRFRNSPFSVSEYIQIPGARCALDREISVDTGNVSRHPDYESKKTERLCLPASCLLLLTGQ